MVVRINNKNKFIALILSIFLVTIGLVIDIHPVVADNPPSEPEAYNYWYAPANSFGAKELKEVNWSYFWSLFKDHSAWQMEGWNPSSQSWVTTYNGHNLNEYLQIIKTRSADNSSEKITLNFTSPYTTKYRFKFGIDLRVKDYVNKTGQYEYMLTYPANATEDYTVKFNWSDLMPLVSQGKISLNHGIKNINGTDIFWFMITGNADLSIGNSFEIDPNFGYWGTISTVINIGNFITADWHECPADCRATSISAKISGAAIGEYASCALYQYVDYSSEYAGVLLGATESKTFETGGLTLIIFNFSTPIGLGKGIKYYITIWGQSMSVGAYSSASLNMEVYKSLTYGTYPDSLTDELPDDDKELYMYCTYIPNSTTSVDAISPYWQNSISTVALTTTDTGTADNVSLFYRWSTDNTSWTGGAWDWHNDTVDSNTSDVDSSPDKGTETTFANARATTRDTNVMTIQEALEKPIDNQPDAVDWNGATKDGIANKGTEGLFANCKETAPDTDVMTLTEANQGTAAVDESLVVTGFTATVANWVENGVSPYLDADDTSNNIFETTTDGSDEYWFTFADTAATGNGFTTRLYVDFDAGDGGDDCAWHIDTNGDNTPEIDGTVANGRAFLNPTTSVMSVAVAELDTAAEINAARLWLEYDSTSGAGDMTVDKANLSIKRTATTDYEFDHEYQFNITHFSSDNEQLCFYLTAAPTETLVVNYYNGGSFASLGNIVHTGWTNFTATGLTSATYNIEILDQNQTNEVTSHSWTIDCMFLHTWNNTNYKIDFEYQWTGANFSSSAEYYCIYVASRTGTENLLAYARTDSNTWVLGTTITGAGWWNVSTDYLLSETFTIRLLGATEASDSEQGSWGIDCIFLQTYNTTGGPSGKDWSLWSSASNPDLASPWAWTFNCPNSTAYYEFYSIGKKSGYSDESAPDTADARCHVNYSAIAINFDINCSSFNFGVVLKNTIYYSNKTSSQYTMIIYNNGSDAIDIDVNGTNATASGVSAWVLSTTNGDDKYVMEIYNQTTNWWKLGLIQDTWYTNMQVGNIRANLRITTPTTFYSGKQMSCHIYMVASIH